MSQNNNTSQPTGLNRLQGLTVTSESLGDGTIIGHHVYKGDVYITYFQESGRVYTDLLSRFSITSESIESLSKGPLDDIGENLKKLMVGMGADPSDVEGMNLFELMTGN